MSTEANSHEKPIRISKRLRSKNKARSLKSKYTKYESWTMYSAALLLKSLLSCNKKSKE